MAYRRRPGGDRMSWNIDNMDYMDDPYEGPSFPGDYRNKRYSDAYGDYSGGYGPQTPLGFGPGPGPDFWPRQPHPPFMTGRGFGPGGPPVKRNSFDDRAIKYLMRCGVAKENLKNLPKDLLQLMEPQYCGLCGQNFDSFPSSRLHYISKNHSKCQKRWLIQRSEKGGFIRKEAPLKARELYCELCDVHITSKQHADSHYSGKPHRAIVEGRKGPKNSMLHQRNMAERLAQLIRREKKHLKVIIDTEAVQNNAESKDVQEKTELYCDICKTSVTCTEQMTMHLNGKKHLNKEKQHILMMMKGDTPLKSDETQDKKDAGVNEDYEETPDDENKDNCEEDYNWGDGSGNWDEPTKP